jgi:protein associated with RNAse G/E
VVRNSQNDEKLMPEKKLVTINSRKFDGKIHRKWQAELFEQTDSKLVFVGEFEKEVVHPILGVIRRGTLSFEFYWLKRNYNIFRFHEPEGNLRNYYCNISFPPTFQNNILDYVDLDVDILVSTDFKYQILDFDEFEQNSRLYEYTADLKQIVDSAVKDVIDLIEKRSFPFNS